MDNSTKERQSIKYYIKRLKRRYNGHSQTKLISEILDDILIYLGKREKRTKKRKGGV